MKNKMKTLLAATLVTLLVSSQSAMALNEDSAGYSSLFNSQTTEASDFPTPAFMDNDLYIGNSENGVDPAYLGYQKINSVVYDNQLNGRPTNFLSGENSPR